MSKVAIAIKGQLYRNEAGSTNYVYPRDNQEWAMELGSDPRELLGRMNLNDDNGCYTLKLTSKGIIYAYRRLLAGRSGSNSAMIMIYVEGLAQNGSQLVEMMRDLLQYAIQQTSAEQIDTNVLDEKIKQYKDAFDFQKKPFSSTYCSFPNEDSKEGYRFYKTDTELADILENPCQPIYAKYKCIHIIPEAATKHLTKNKDIEYIATPLESMFYFKLPKGVTVSENLLYVSSKQTFALTYHKEEYEDRTTESLQVRTPSPFFAVEGNNIIVKSAEECKLEFFRKITIVVYNDKQPSDKLKSWCLKSAKKTYFPDPNTGVLVISLPDDEYILPIKAEGYEDGELKMDTRKNQKYSVVLSAKQIQTKVCLKSAWKRNQGNPPTEPSTLTLSSYAPLLTLYPELKNTSSYVCTLYVSKTYPLRLTIVTGIISFICGALILGMLWYFYPQANNHVLPDSEVKENKEEKQEDTHTQVKGQESLEKEDESYLSKENVWEYQQLKSDKYKNFYNILIFKDAGSDREKNVKVYSKKNLYDKTYIRINNNIWEVIRASIEKGANGNGYDEARKYKEKLKLCRDKIDLNQIIKTESEGAGGVHADSSKEQLPEG